MDGWHVSVHTYTYVDKELNVDFVYVWVCPHTEFIFWVHG